MAKVLIIYSSLSGNTEKMANAVAEGVRSAGGTPLLKKGFEANADDLLNCDAAVFGTPNYFAYEAGAVKDFFDRSFFALMGKVKDKPYGLFGSYGNGGDTAIQSLGKLCTALGLKKSADDVGAQREPNQEALEKCKALGTKMALL